MADVPHTMAAKIIRIRSKVPHDKVWYIDVKQDGRYVQLSIFSTLTTPTDILTGFRSCRYLHLSRGRGLQACWIRY